MRIIGGSFRGRRLPKANKMELRPTTDFAREGLFNLLHHRVDLEDISFCDLFSGTGSISLELKSRGAGDGMAVDISKNSARYRDRLKTEWGIKKWRNLTADVFQFLERGHGPFDLVIADPPYDHERLKELPELVMESGILAEGGIFILEHPESYSFERIPYFVEARNYGRVHFSFFEPQLQ